MIEQSSYMAAMRTYFGLQPGQTAHSFLLEMKALTEDDNAWFRAQLLQVGYQISADPEVA